MSEGLKMQLSYEEVLPDPKRVIEGLRDTGYQIEMAIEDIIDNSIAAGAKNIDVRLLMDMDGDIEVFIADDGCGMNRADLIDAMRYGSKIRPNPASLGKFGLGLKTASTAFCRELSVISKDQESSEYVKATWDLDHVAEVGRWELALSSPSAEEISLIRNIADDGSGTLVVWRKVDRLIKAYSDPGGVRARKALDKTVDSLSKHCSMVYQRFLDRDDDRADNIGIILNSSPISPFNPFCPSESEVVLSQPVKTETEDGRTAEFMVTAYVLPNKAEFSTNEAYQASRPGNDNQGIYVYRENRLIHGPDWMKMYSKEPHMSLLRVEFSFDHLLDEAFHIDIKKSQINLIEDLYVYLKEQFLPPCRRAAEERYRTGKRQDAQEKSVNLHDISNKAIQVHADDISNSNIRIIDKSKGEVEITNKFGQIRQKIRIIPPEKPGMLRVQAVESLEDGILWAPCLIESSKGVQINTGHPYYSKVYLPNRKSGITIQALDSLLWGLCEAEFSTINENTKKFFEEMRREVSRLLRTLVEDLPESDDDESAV